MYTLFLFLSLICLSLSKGQSGSLQSPKHLKPHPTSWTSMTYILGAFLIILALFLLKGNNYLECARRVSHRNELIVLMKPKEKQEEKKLLKTAYKLF